MKEIKFNLQHMVKKKEFYWAILVTLFINIIQVFFVVYNHTLTGGFLENSYSAEYQSILYNPLVAFYVLNVIVFPIIYSMIFSDSSWLEESMKMTNVLYFRMSNRKNIIVRFVLTFFVTLIISFGGFMVNYLLLSILFPNGNFNSYVQEIGFYLLDTGNFLDHLRITNPTNFAILINLSVSVLLGIMSSFSYACSFFVKHRVILYFIPFIYIIVNDLFCSILRITQFSFVQKLQPFNSYSLSEYFITAGITLLFGIILIFCKLKKKDCLL